MARRTRKARRTTRSKAQKSGSRPPRAGEGNPSWQKSFVTLSTYQNWGKGRSEREDGPSPRKLQSGPGDPGNRMSVELSEDSRPFQRDPRDYVLTISGRSRLQHIHDIRLHITLEQAYSFEESVRAVFQAAREEGILPRHGGVK